MNSKQENPYSNSSNIIKKAYDYFRLKIENKETFSWYELPSGITKEMLYQELKCMDLTTYYEKVSVEYLWKQYVYIHSSFNNKFGFTQLPKEFISQEERNLLKFSNNTTLVHYVKYSKQENKRAQTSRRRSTTAKRSSSRKKQKSYSNISYVIRNTKIKSRGRSRSNSVTRKRPVLIHQRGGFNGNYQNLQKVITDINQSELPKWYSSFTSFIKIKDINNHPIYLHASSLPMPNEPRYVSSKRNCSNLLNFYRFVMDIPKIISLQGCDLDWSFLPTGYIPESCQGVNELINWNETCSRYDEPTVETSLTPEIAESISDPRSNMMEFHWIDMHAGFFNVYDNLSKIDFTNKANNSVIHCLAGYGRTGVAILLIICVNYYRANRSRFNSDFFVNSKKPNDFKSTSIVRKLKSLLKDFIEFDTDIPDNLGISPSMMREIKNSITRFDITKISNEVFLHNFYDNYGFHISYTAVNVFITRVNYIIYFTTLRNNIKQFPLFSLKSASYFINNIINSDNELFEHILNKGNLYSHNEVEKIMNDADIVGFDLQELPIVEGFNFEILPEIDETSSSSRCSIS
jgi:hypothetical protein